MANAMTVQNEKVKSFRALLERGASQIAAALPKHMTHERMIRVSCTAIQKTPKLLECDQLSVFAAIIQASQLGLEPDGVLGHAYLVPFYNKKTRRQECKFMPGYRGLIELARRSGQISTIYAHVVHVNDEFSFEFGLEPKLTHRPASGDPGPMIAVYAVARLRDGGVQYELMWKREVDAIRARAQAGEDGPWVTDYEEMAKKTAFRRLCKILPVSPELSRAVAIDDCDDPPAPAPRPAYTAIDAEAVAAIAGPEEEPAEEASDQENVDPPTFDRLGAYVEEAKDRRTLANIYDSLDDLEGKAELTPDEAAELRKAIETKLDGMALAEGRAAAL